MPVHNAEIAEILNTLADLLEIEGANEFRVRAYREAANTVGSLSQSADDMLADGEDLSELPEVGESISGKIEEIVRTGQLSQLEEVKERTPVALAEMTKIPGLGPKRVRALYEEVGISSLDELNRAAREERVREVEGFGPKLEAEILEELEDAKGDEGRTLVQTASQIAEPFLAYLRGDESIEEVEIAGSYRRRKETVGDLDIVAASQQGGDVIQRFVAYEDVEEIISQGETRSSVVLRSGMQVDLRVVPPQEYGAACLYLTGSRSHNLDLRDMALDRDLKLNEYGVFKGDERIAGETEEEVYAVFDLAYIEPELRESRGEIEAAREGELPQLITQEDLRGDLQMHTQASDGHASLEEMAGAALDLGYEYIAITDHSEHIGIVQGLDAERLAEQSEAIERLNEELEGITLLKGVEVDILQDGSLALQDEILQKVDVCLVSVHSKFDLSREAQTERILRALDNPHVNILAHPTGRMIGRRQPYEVYMERIMEAALERGCFLELNAYPSRLDINDAYCKMAKEMGLKVVISTDAHRPSELDYMRYGVGQARRGWLEAGDVLNTRGLDELKDALRRN